MPRPKLLRTLEEINKVPLDQPVTIDLTAPSTATVSASEKIEKNDNGLSNDDIVVGSNSVTTSESRKSKKDAKEAKEAKNSEEPNPLQKRIQEMEAAQAKYESELATERAALAKERKEKADLAKSYHEEVGRLKNTTEQAELESVLNALGAAQAEAEAAQIAVDAAIREGDTKAIAEAYRRMARAEAQSTSLEQAKIVLEQNQETERLRQEQQVRETPKTNGVQQGNDFESAIASLPPKAQTWINSHREYWTDVNKHKKITAAHQYVTEISGVPEFTDKYFDELEIHLGIKQRQAANERNDDDDDYDDGDTLVSAPPTRETPKPSGERSNNDRITLSPEQREAAKLAGISEVEYANNLIKLQEYKNARIYDERH